jgi:hypothetical protein
LIDAHCTAVTALGLNRIALIFDEFAANFAADK